MAPKTFARIEDGRVAELFATHAEIGELFHPALMWTDISTLPEVMLGWTYDGDRFSPPPPVVAPPAPSLADLHAQFQAIKAQIDGLASGS